MKVRNLLTTVLAVGIILCSLLMPSHAQDESNRRPRMVISYNDKIGGSEAEQWRLEDFRETLLTEPDAQAYIIAYNGREDYPGKARRYALRAKNYLVEARGIVPQRIVAIEGGRREEFIVEIWLAPKGAVAPVPTPSVVEQNDFGDNLLYDSFGVWYDNFGKYEDAKARLDGFALALKKEPSSWGCIVVYAQNGDDRIGIEWDSPGTALLIAQGQKGYLVKEHGFTRSRITAVDGGYSEGRIVELWIMRPKARFDMGPFVYPDRLRVKGNGTLAITDRDTYDPCCKACLRKGANSRIR